MKKAVGALNDAADGITAGLSELLSEDAPEPSSDRTSVPDIDAKSKGTGSDDYGAPDEGTPQIQDLSEVRTGGGCE